MIEFDTFTLSNGLRVIHNRDRATPMVAVDLLYNVGSRDESADLTGLAHLFEHLMFGGSVNIPEFDVAIERAGGWNNAWTSNDFTNFYDVVPAANLETALWLESDRMLGLSFSPKSLEVQRNVVVEEFKQTCLNTPYGDMMHGLRAMLYKTHPYRYPTIGKEPQHILDTRPEDVRNFFYSHYAPNNAVLAVSGNVTLDDTRRLVEKWFGPIGRRPIAPRAYQPEAPVESPRRVEMTGNVPLPIVVVAFPMPGYGHEDYIACDLITDILASGRSSRLYRRLTLGDPDIIDADASIIGSEEPGFIMLTARVASDDDRAVSHAEEALMDQARELAADGVTPEELERALNRFDSNFTFSSVSYLAKAQSLAMAMMHSEDINSIVPAYRRTTPDDILRAARRYLDPQHSATLVYLPER